MSILLGERCITCRVLSFMIALLLVPVTLVTVLLIAPFILWETRSNPIFVQTRVGYNGEYFNLYKLRTIAPGTPSVATHNLPSAKVTRSGSLIRRSKLDELPQILNVLLGDMVVVGPRPCLPTQKSLIKARESSGVLSLKPGITGLSQVRKIDMSDEVRLVASDKEYLATRSLIKDLSVILKTVIGKGGGDRVYLGRK